MRSGRPVLVGFVAQGTESSRGLPHELEQLARAYAVVLDVALVDLEASPRLAGALGIQSVPTVMLFQPGALPRRVTGSSTAAEIDLSLGLDELRPRPVQMPDPDQGGQDRSEWPSSEVHRPAGQRKGARPDQVTEARREAPRAAASHELVWLMVLVVVLVLAAGGWWFFHVQPVLGDAQRLWCRDHVFAEVDQARRELGYSDDEWAVQVLGPILLTLPGPYATPGPPAPGWSEVEADTRYQRACTTAYQLAH